MSISSTCGVYRALLAPGTFDGSNGEFIKSFGFEKAVILKVDPDGVSRMLNVRTVEEDCKLSGVDFRNELFSDELE